MKSTTIELNVDFIGGQESLTKEEENALSKYFQQKKQKKEIKKTSRRTNLSTRKLEKV